MRIGGVGIVLVVGLAACGGDSKKKENLTFLSEPPADLCTLSGLCPTGSPEPTDQGYCYGAWRIWDAPQYFSTCRYDGGGGAGTVQIGAACSGHAQVEQVGGHQGAFSESGPNGAGHRSGVTCWDYYDGTRDRAHSSFLLFGEIAVTGQGCDSVVRNLIRCTYIPVFPCGYSGTPLCGTYYQCVRYESWDANQCPGYGAGWTRSSFVWEGYPLGSL